MNTHILALASGLSDQDLLARIGALAGKEREASVDLVAHLAALETRPSLYASEGCGSLFSYCTRGTSSERWGAATEVSAPSSPEMDTGARNARSSSSITSCRMRREDRRPSRTSPFVAGATTNTR